jgi:hypothetical protein
MFARGMRRILSEGGPAPWFGRAAATAWSTSPVSED